MNETPGAPQPTDPATPTPTYGSAQVAPSHQPANVKKWGRLTAGGLAVLVIGGKIALALGIGSAFGFAKDHVEHKVPEAETVVQSMLESNDGATVRSYLATGVTLATVIDSACAEFMADDSWSKFTIPRSSKASDGSADVKVDPDGKSTTLNFHLVDQSGWKVERVTCEN